MSNYKHENANNNTPSSAQDISRAVTQENFDTEENSAKKSSIPNLSSDSKGVVVSSVAQSPKNAATTKFAEHQSSKTEENPAKKSSIPNLSSPTGGQGAFPTGGQGALPTGGQGAEYTITVYTENHIGLLNRIAIIFSRRKINIESLNTSPSEVESIHRFTIVIHETEEVVSKLVRQIEKQVEVLKAYYNTADEIVWQELALYKVPTDEIAEKVKVERLLREFGARAVVIRKDYTVFETTGHREETDKLIEVLAPFGLIEFVRSARVAVIKNSSGFHDKLKEFEEFAPAEETIENEYLNERDIVFDV